MAFLSALLLVMGQGPCRVCYVVSRVLSSKLYLGGAYSLVACLSHLATDHASFSRRAPVPTPNRDTSNIFGGSLRFWGDVVVWCGLPGAYFC